MKIKSLLPKKSIDILDLYLKHFILRQIPVIVYTPGRVGSISMVYALKKHGIYSFKVELFDKEVWGSIKFCKRNLIDVHKPAKIISLVRDPIEMISSFFFSKSIRGHLPLGNAAVLEGDILKLQEAFKEEILEGVWLNYFLDWFTKEFYQHLKIDVYNYPFNKKEGFGVLNDDTYPTLIIKSSVDDDKKAELVRNFLKVDNFTIDKINVRAERGSGKLYQAFKEELVIEPKYMDKICNSKYVNHFFTKEEISEMRRNWS